MICDKSCDKSRTHDSDFRQPESSVDIQGQANWGAAQCRGGHSLFVQEPCQQLFLSRIGHQTLLVVVKVLYGRTQVYEAPQLRSVKFRCTRTSCPMQRLGPATPTLAWTLCCGAPDAELGGYPNRNLIAHTTSCEMHNMPGLGLESRPFVEPSVAHRSGYPSPCKASVLKTSQPSSAGARLQCI